MRTALLLGLLAVAAPVAAQTDGPPCPLDECALRAEPAARLLGVPSLITRVVRVSADTTVTGGLTFSLGPDRPLAPVVASSAEAVRHARTYDRLETASYVVGLVGSALFLAYAVDDLGADYLGREAELAVLGGSLATLAVIVPLRLRSRRAAGAAVEAYNAGLGR